MKKCATCGEFKPESEYYWRDQSQGKRWGTCKECQKKQRHDWYERNKETHIANTRETKQRMILEARQYVWDYLSSHPCVDCGESDPTVLEFDHVRGKKKSDITMLAGQGYSIETVQEEINKCEVRCANCHRKKTAKERGWFRGK